MNAQTFTAKTQSIFTDNAGRRTVGRQASGSGIDGSRLALLGCGDFRVFTRPADRKFKNWHIEMLIDSSGSIERDGRSDPLVETVTQLHDALRASQVGKLGVYGVNTLEHDFRHFMEKKNKGAFRQFLHDCRYGSGDSGGEGTHDGYFIEAAMNRLLASHCPGKIILAFSDGEPKCDRPGYCGKPGCAKGGDHGIEGLSAVLRAALGKARKQGVIALGIGIQAEHIKKFYGENHSVSVNNLNELFSKTAGILEKNIIRG